MEKKEPKEFSVCFFFLLFILLLFFVNKNMKIDPIQRTGTKAENEDERCALKTVG